MNTWKTAYNVLRVVSGASAAALALVTFKAVPDMNGMNKALTGIGVLSGVNAMVGGAKGLSAMAAPTPTPEVATEVGAK